jgi:hypothetical protein
MTEEQASTDDDKKTGKSCTWYISLASSKNTKKMIDHETKEPAKRTFSVRRRAWQIHLKRSAGSILRLM